MVESPTPITVQPQVQGDWARAPKEGSLFEQLLEQMQALRADVHRFQVVQENMARAFGRRLNLRDEDIHNLLNPRTNGRN